jgi:hypothetical protein
MRRRNPLLVPGTRNIHYWQYFVALEADLAATARYVEPTSANMACYSVEFARILLTAGSEVDVLCKVLCQEHKLLVSPVNINGYRAAITKRFPGFTKLEILAPRYGLVRLPWQQWDQNSNPNWWRSYNDVKHERQGHFASANLGNALDAMAGLFVLVSYLCEEELRARTALPWPQMLTLDPSLSSDIRTNARPGHVLPDFAP